jgi:ureidoglycolate dehydrogenase (NAD+)
MRISKQDLHELIKNKINKAGLSEEHADVVADCLTYSDARGYHSHGAVRVEYYSERIAKGGINANPKFEFKTTGPASGVYEGDNGVGFVVAKNGMEEAIKMAKENGVAVIGMKHLSHSGSLGYYVEMAAKEDLVAISICQSDPMVVPHGGSEAYYGTNPIAFGAPSNDARTMVFDMATTVQAWGKVLHARSKGDPIPDTWAVDQDGNPTTDTMKVNALVPIAGAKGYGLMMMVDILSGIMLGLPFGKHVSSMYEDLSKGRDLGQLHIVIDPSRFTDIDNFKKYISQTFDELKEIKPAPGFDQVHYPGERALLRKAAYDKDGIEIVDEIYEYLVSEDIHYNNYDKKNKFAE